MIDAIATTIVIGMIAEMRLAMHAFHKRLRKIEGSHNHEQTTAIMPRIGIVLLCCMLTLAYGCGAEHARPVVNPASPGNALASLGIYAQWVGGIAGIAGFVLRFFIPAPVLSTLGLLGACVAAFGLGFEWLGSNRWVALSVVCGGCAVAVVRHRHTIRRILRLTPKPKEHTP